VQAVALQFNDAAHAQQVMTEALAASFLPSADAPPAGTVCKVTLQLGEHSLELFALAKAGGYRLTDDPSDLRYQINSFLEVIGPTAAAGAVTAPPLAQVPGEAGEPVSEPAAEERDSNDSGAEEIQSEELAAIQSEVGSKDPLLAEMKRIQALQLPQKIRLAEDGDLTQRTLLYRMYGKLVFDGLLRNPRITEAEVAKLAKLATIGLQQLQVIARRAEWVKSERVRNALLGNSRVPLAMAQKIINMLTRYEIKPLLQRRDFPPQVQAAIKDAHWKLANR
jgi:hypothetical protein